MDREIILMSIFGVLILISVASMFAGFEEQRNIGDAFCKEMDYVKHSMSDERYKELDEEIFIKCEKIEDGQLIEDYIKADQETRYSFKETKNVIDYSILSIPVLFLILAIIPISFIRGGKNEDWRFEKEQYRIYYDQIGIYFREAEQVFKG